MPAAQRTASAPIADEGVFITQPAPQEKAIAGAERTSIASRHHAADEITVRFTKWHPHGNTAYQRGSFAGFRRDIALRLVAQGIAVVAELPEHRFAGGIITK